MLTMNKEMTPTLLMVSGGSDSMALLELAVLRQRGNVPAGDTGRRLLTVWDSLLGDGPVALKCLHINHLLRGEASDGDEKFVKNACQRLEVPFIAKHVDVAALCAESSAGMEAIAREQRYLVADTVLDAWCTELAVPCERGVILTAHTLDDRVETYLMRTLVGTGPGGLGSIPRSRGRIQRPLLDALREELRDFLREQHPGMPDEGLWREDATNEDGSNFRSRVRMQLMPQMRALVPGFEHNLARTMDLIAEEDAALVSRAQSIVYRSLIVGEHEASISVEVLRSCDAPMARRVLRQCLLVVNPQARLESRQINRVLDALTADAPFSTEVDSGIRVTREGAILHMRQLRQSRSAL